MLAPIIKLVSDWRNALAVILMLLTLTAVTTAGLVLRSYQRRYSGEGGSAAQSIANFEL